jgi:hypothetical protein
MTHLQENKSLLREGKSCRKVNHTCGKVNHSCRKVNHTCGKINHSCMKVKVTCLSIKVILIIVITMLCLCRSNYMLIFVTLYHQSGGVSLEVPTLYVQRLEHETIKSMEKNMKLQKTCSLGRKTRKYPTDTGTIFHSSMS